MPALDPASTWLAPQPCAAQRIDFIDLAKGTGIVLVVAAHAPGAPTAVMTAIYSFHMPLFFFISGYLDSVGGRAATLPDAVRRAMRSLLVPYVFFFALSLAYWLATRNLGSRADKFAGVDAWDALSGLASGLSSDLFVNVTLWFFPCLFLCKVIHAVARQWFSPTVLLMLLAVLAMVLLERTLPWNTRLPWGLDIVWVALVFYATGCLVRTLRGPWTNRWPGAGIAASILLALLWIALVPMQGRVDLAAANFGRHPLLFVPCALAGVGFAVSVASLCPPSRVLRVLGDNSLVIFPLHPLLINAASGALQWTGLKALATNHGWVWWLVSTAWGLVASLWVARLLKRHVPALLGMKTVPRLGRSS